MELKRREKLTENQQNKMIDLYIGCCLYCYVTVLFKFRLPRIIIVFCLHPYTRHDSASQLVVAHAFRTVRFHHLFLFPLNTRLFQLVFRYVAKEKGFKESRLSPKLFAKESERILVYYYILRAKK